MRRFLGKSTFAPAAAAGASSGVKRRARERIDGLRRQGSVLEWRGKYGWIRCDETVDHPEAGAHGGKIYVNVADLGSGVELVAEARASFFLYADGQGLGAEDVWLEESWSAPAAPAEPPATCGKSKGKTAKGKGKSGVAPDGAPGPLSGAKGKSSPDAGDGGKARGKLGQKGFWPPSKGAAGKGFSKGPSREKTTHEGQHGYLHWASSELQGWRPQMEDAMLQVLELPEPLDRYALFGVFDGHGGKEVSRRTAEALPQTLIDSALEVASQGADDEGGIAQFALEAALPAWDAALRLEGEGKPGVLNSAASGKPILSDVENAFGLMGSTAVVALVECEGSPSEGRPWRVVVANCGDSRAMLCRDGEAVELSEDHKPDSPEERFRIEGAGGFVAAVGPCQRIDGWGLNLSRALGDFHYKARDDLPPEQQKVSCIPEIRICEVTEQDEFLLLACDGVFELHSSQDAVSVVRGALEAGKPLTEVVETLVDASCSDNLARTNGSGADNVSAMVVLLR